MFEKARALQKYAAKKKDELSFNKGEIIDVISGSERDDWWYGKVGKRKGMFHRKYVALEIFDKCKVIYAYLDVNHGELELHPGDVIQILEKQDQAWYGRIDDREGWFPPTFVQEIECLDLPRQPILQDVRKFRPKKPQTRRSTKMEIKRQIPQINKEKVISLLNSLENTLIQLKILLNE